MKYQGLFAVFLVQTSLLHRCLLDDWNGESNQGDSVQLRLLLPPPSSSSYTLLNITLKTILQRCPQ